MMGVEGRRLEVPAAGSPPETDASRNQLKRYQTVYFRIILNHFSPSNVQVILFLYELYYIFTQDSK
jgi:hypothetical protein